MSVSIKINDDDLDPTVRDIGLLTELLTKEDQNQLTLNDTWFQNPWDNIEGVPKRPEQLLDLLTSILGDPAPNTPNESDRVWYPVTYKNNPTGLHFVLSKNHKEQPACAGVGLWKEFKNNGAITITPYFYFPLFSMTTEATGFVLGQSGTPVETVVEVKSTTPFNCQEKSFNTLQVKGRIYFDKKTSPSLEVNFLDLKKMMGTGTLFAQDGIKKLIEYLSLTLLTLLN